MLYWKKYDKVEKEHRKRAEKEALEQRKLDEEMREVADKEVIVHGRWVLKNLKWLCSFSMALSVSPVGQASAA